MKRNKLITLFCLLTILVFSITTSAFTLYNPSSVNKSDKQGDLVKNFQNDKYHKMNKEILMQNLGLTPEEVKKAKESGKSLIELAKEKGKSLDEIKAAIIDAKTKTINQAVKDGKLTREEGDKKITKVKEKITKWDGSTKHKNEHKHNEKGKI